MSTLNDNNEQRLIDTLSFWAEGKVFENAKLKNSKNIFVTHVLENAVNLEQYGVAAIAINSKWSLEDYYHKHKGIADKYFIQLFDNNNEDIDGLKKTITGFKSLGIKNYKIAIPPRGKTWNDLIASGQLAHDKIEKTLDNVFENSPLTYFCIVRDPDKKTKTLIFEFNNRIFKGYLKEIKLDNDIDYEPKVELLIDCNIRLLYSVIDDSQDDKQKMEHYIEIYSEQEGKGRIRLTAAELSRLGSFKAALQNLILFLNNERFINLVAGFNKAYRRLIAIFARILTPSQYLFYSPNSIV